MSIDVNWSLLFTPEAGPSAGPSTTSSPRYQANGHYGAASLSPSPLPSPGTADSHPAATTADTPEEALASSLIKMLNSQLSSAKRPSFIGPITVTAFSFGKTGPELEIKDIRDVWRVFDEGDEEGDQKDRAKEDVDGGEGEQGSRQHRNRQRDGSMSSGLDSHHEAEYGYGEDEGMVEEELRYGSGTGQRYKPNRTATARTVGMTMPHRLGQAAQLQGKSHKQTPSVVPSTPLGRSTSYHAGPGLAGLAALAGAGAGGSTTASASASLSTPPRSFVPYPFEHHPSSVSVGLGPVHFPPPTPGFNPYPTSASSSMFAAGLGLGTPGVGGLGRRGPASIASMPAFSGLRSPVLQTQSQAYGPTYGATASVRHRDGAMAADGPNGQSRAAPPTRGAVRSTQTREPTLLSPPPSPPARPKGFPSADTSSASSSSVPSLQIHLHLSHTSDLHLTLLTSLQVNYPSSLFMALPLKISITGFQLEGEVVMAYSGEKNRVHLTILDEDPVVPQTPGPGHTFTSMMEDRRSQPVGQRLLPNLQIESEIGHVDAHVLRNVGKVERFIVDVVRKTLVDELVFPNFHTIAL
ncbi:hypothetical protein IAU60_001368 [Kwoniella sp. DSM 27419]